MQKVFRFKSMNIFIYYNEGRAPVMRLCVCSVLYSFPFIFVFVWVCVLQKCRNRLQQFFILFFRLSRVLLLLVADSLWFFFRTSSLLAIRGSQLLLHRLSRCLGQIGGLNVFLHANQRLLQSVKGARVQHLLFNLQIRTKGYTISL